MHNLLRNDWPADGRGHATTGPVQACLQIVVASFFCLCLSLATFAAPRTPYDSGSPPGIQLALQQSVADSTSQQTDATDGGPSDALAREQRQGYLVEVELPLIGERDQAVRQQISRIADANSDVAQRPVVVLAFRPVELDPTSAGLGSGAGSRGSQFERGLALARFLTSPEAARVRLVAYVPETVEGHAVLPVLACEEIYVASGAMLGRAAIDDPLDATIQGAYRDVVSRRATLPQAVVDAMLQSGVEAYEVTLTDGSRKVVDRPELDKLREAGEVLEESTVWAGGALASFSGAQLRSRRWIAGTAEDVGELSRELNLGGSLRTSRQLPREWKPLSVKITGTLTAARVNQIIRAVEQHIEDESANLLVVIVEPTQTDFRQASRLASFLSEKPSDALYTISLVEGKVSGPIGLVAVACDEAVLIGQAALGPPSAAQNEANNAQDGAAEKRERNNKKRGESLASDETVQRVLDDLSRASGRPLPLMSVLVDDTIKVQEFIQQETGQRAIFTEWQIASQADANLWLAKRSVAGGDWIENDVALQYRMVDSVEETPQLALGNLGIESLPKELATPWLDSSIEMLLAQSWLPRLLLSIGFFALMVELGAPGISAGGLLAAVCFVGFFWIEGLNGNVEWLEILLFLGGLTALAIELFVLPGFGLFGIGGLLMLLVSVVLASQTFVWPTTSAELSEVSVNLFWVACLALGGMIGILFMHKRLEQSPLLRWVTLDPTTDEDAHDLDGRETTAHREHLWGQEGLTTTRLNPSGKAQFGREVVGVVGTGGLIPEGTPVRVVEVRGPLVIVEEMETIE